MLLAEVEEFWKTPNVFDLLTLAGFVLGLASIWVAWWLAKRDIEKRLAEAGDRASAAARDEVRRVARAVLQTGISATIRSLELAREACNGKRWPRAVELCILAREQMARTLAQPAADVTIQTELRETSARLVDCVTRLRKQPRTGTGEAPEEILRGLDESIVDLNRVESRMTGIRSGNDHG